MEAKPKAGDALVPKPKTCAAASSKMKVSPLQPEEIRAIEERSTASLLQKIQETRHDPAAR